MKKQHKNANTNTYISRRSIFFIEKYHRHHKKPIGSIFQIGISNGDKMVGVAVVGRPVARNLQDGFTAEVIRLCTDGTKNACSMLYAACWRGAKSIGYRRIITYILKEEEGCSLRAAGWTLLGERGGGSWSVPSRPRTDKHPLQVKKLYEAKINGPLPIRPTKTINSSIYNEIRLF